MVGWDVYLCYKKSQGTSKRLAYKPTVLDYFPKPQNEEEDLSLAQNIPLFCLPMGALIECWPVKCQPPDKSFTTFVLTDEVSYCLFLFKQFRMAQNFMGLLYHFMQAIRINYPMNSWKNSTFSLRKKEEQ